MALHTANQMIEGHLTFDFAESQNWRKWPFVVCSKSKVSIPIHLVLQKLTREPLRILPEINSLTIPFCEPDYTTLSHLATKLNLLYLGLSIHPPKYAIGFSHTWKTKMEINVLLDANLSHFKVLSETSKSHLFHQESKIFPGHFVVILFKINLQNKTLLVETFYIIHHLIQNHNSIEHLSLRQKNHLWFRN